MQGFPIETAARLRKLTERQLIVAGGIRSQQEVDALDALGADAVVGMAVYTESACSVIRRVFFWCAGRCRRKRRNGNRICWKQTLPPTLQRKET